MNDLKSGLNQRSGLQKIKTTTGLSSKRKVRKPHEAYLELSSLELERHRLKIEKENAEGRIISINNRIKDIDKEEIRLHKFIEKPNDLCIKDECGTSNGPQPVQSYSVSKEAIRERVLNY